MCGMTRCVETECHTARGAVTNWHCGIVAEFGDVSDYEGLGVTFWQRARGGGGSDYEGLRGWRVAWGVH